MKTKYLVVAIVMCIIIVVGAIAAYELLQTPTVATAKENLVIDAPVEWVSWDPSVETTDFSAGLENLIFEPLTIWDFGGTEIYTPVPCLATSWTRINDTAWEFKLRHAKFQDGTDFTAWDVKFTYEKILNPNQPAAFRYQVQPNKYFEVIDNYTIRIGADVSWGLTPLLLGVHFNAIQSAVAYGGTGTTDANKKQAIGTGPYKLVSWTKGEKIELERFDNWWNISSYPNMPKKITIRFVPDPTARVVDLESGAVDYVHSVVPADVKRLTMLGYNVPTFPAFRVHLISFNIRKPPFDDRRVRLAVSYAINRKDIADSLYMGLVFPAQSIISPLSKGYIPNWPVQYDPEQAKALLAQAGYPNGFTCNFYTNIHMDLMDSEHVQAIAAYLDKVGIKATIVPMEWAAYADFMKAQSKKLVSDVDMYFFSWGARDMYHLLNGNQFARSPAYNGTAGWGNMMGWYNTTLEQTFADFRVASPNAYPALYQKMNDIMIGDLPAIPLINENLLMGTVKELKGVYITPYEDLRVWQMHFEAPPTTKSSALSLFNSNLPMFTVLASISAVVNRLPSILPLRRKLHITN